MRRLAALLVLAAPLLLGGCIGIYSNTSKFLNTPREGTTEIELIERYGTPAFSSYVQDRRVYTYKVRDTKYILVAGIYDGYDLVVVCQNGLVTSTSRVERPRALAILNPVPWAVAD